MSRFLQRIVATARSSGGSIRPVLGSVYSPAAATPMPAEWRDTALAVESGARSAEHGPAEDAMHVRAAVDSRQEVADPAGRAARVLGRGPATEPEGAAVPPLQSIGESRDRGEAAGTRQERAGHTVAAAHVVAAARAVAEAPAAATMNSATGGALPDQTDGTAQTVAALPAGGDAAAAGRDAFHAERVSAAGRYSPLMSDDAGGAGSALRLRKPASGGPHELPRPRPAARDADDIQIHIGRIEVIAAPPAPTRPAAPPRKSPSLDEFLKRRPGRGG